MYVFVYLMHTCVLAPHYMIVYSDLYMLCWGSLWHLGSPLFGWVPLCGWFWALWLGPVGWFWAFVFWFVWLVVGPWEPNGLSDPQHYMYVFA